MICRAKSLPWLPKANLTFVQISRDAYQIRAFRINHKKALWIPNLERTVGFQSAKKWNLCSKSKMSTFVYYCAEYENYKCDFLLVIDLYFLFSWITELKFQNINKIQYLPQSWGSNFSDVCQDFWLGGVLATKQSSERVYTKVGR